MIAEFRCTNDECPYVREARLANDGEVDDGDRREWYGGSHGATRVDPGYYEGDECPECGEAGELIGEYSAREMREMEDPRL